MDSVSQQSSIYFYFRFSHRISTSVCVWNLSWVTATAKPLNCFPVLAVVRVLRANKKKNCFDPHEMNFPQAWLSVEKRRRRYRRATIRYTIQCHKQHLFTRCYMLQCAPNILRGMMGAHFSQMFLPHFRFGSTAIPTRNERQQHMAEWLGPGEMNKWQTRIQSKLSRCTHRFSFCKLHLAQHTSSSSASSSASSIAILTFFNMSTSQWQLMFCVYDVHAAGCCTGAVNTTPTHYKLSLLIINATTCSGSDRGSFLT